MSTGDSDVGVPLLPVPSLLDSLEHKAELSLSQTGTVVGANGNVSRIQDGDVSRKRTRSFRERRQF